ncbi:hypothetical protein EDD15DRAFT_2197027 [Pisolithus albus]|nr:hypothetical protein EDD15DRAFT_2197027 [Pisolithus albus]
MQFLTYGLENLNLSSSGIYLQPVKVPDHQPLSLWRWSQISSSPVYALYRWVLQLSGYFDPLVLWRIHQTVSVYKDFGGLSGGIYEFQTGSRPEVEAPVFTGSVFQKGVEGRRGEQHLYRPQFVHWVLGQVWLPSLNTGPRDINFRSPVVLVRPGNLVPVLPVTGTASGNGTLTPNKGSDSPNRNKVRNGTGKPVFRPPVGLRRRGVAVTLGSGRTVVTNVTVSPP